MFLGLTGNIGSGKTTVLNLFEQAGFECFNADKMVHAMFENSHSSYQAVAQNIDEILHTDFIHTSIIDRAILRTFIAKDSHVLKQLADIVHPFLVQEISHLKHEEKNIIIEVPLLFEQDIGYLFDKTILVTCPDEIRVERISLRNPQWTPSYIQQLIQAQMSQEEKIQKSNFVIQNRNLNELTPQIIEIIHQIKNNFLKKSF